MAREFEHGLRSLAEAAQRRRALPRRRRSSRLARLTASAGPCEEFADVVGGDPDRRELPVPGQRARGSRRIGPEQRDHAIDVEHQDGLSHLH